MEWVSYILFSFQGRVNRLTWLAFFVSLAVAEWVCGDLLREMAGMPAPAAGSPEDYFGDRAAFLAGLIFLWPSLAIDVKRWHDIGKSGWFALIAYGPAFAMFFAEELKKAGMLPAAPLQGPLVSLIGLIFLAYLIWLGARKGAPSANRFGEGPS